MGGFLHLYIGQESVAVGTCSLMGDHDHVITAYRCHGHALAVGMTMNECMAELYRQSDRLLEGQGRLDALLRAGQELSGAATASSAARLRSASASPTASNTRASKARRCAFWATAR